MTPDPRLVLLPVCGSPGSPKKKRNVGSSIRGWRRRLSSWAVKMLTTAGMAVLAASLYEADLPAAAGAADAFAVTTGAGGVDGNRSGRRVATTNNSARHIVAVSAKITQSLRMRHRF